MDITLRDAEFVFGKIGVERVESTHHVRGFVVVDGRRVLPIHFSRGRGSMPPRTAILFRQSLKLSEAELREFLRCHLSREDYLDKIAALTGSDDRSLEN